VKTYLAYAILTTLFCCLPFGVVAIVKASQVNSKLAAGDYDGAVKASNQAKMWSLISLLASVVVGVIYFIAVGLSN
jgi:predicted secreted protein